VSPSQQGRRKVDTLSSIGRIAGARMPPTAPPVDRKAWLRHHVREAFFGNLGLKFLSLILALTIFLLVNNDRDHDIPNVPVGVGYLEPDDRVLVSEKLSEVRVTIRGPWRRLRRFDEREIDRIDLDLRQVQDGEIVFTPDMVKLPTGLSVVSITPRTLKVAFEQKIDRAVEVTPVVAGRPLHGYEVKSYVATPATVRARGAKGVIKTLDALRTREIRVDGRSESFSIEVPLVPPDGVEVEPSGAVAVQVKIDEQFEERRLGKLTVWIRGDGVDPAKVAVDPPTVEVVLSGKVRALEEAIKNGVSPTIKLTPAEAGRRHTATVTVDDLPREVGVKLIPSKVEVAPRAGARPPPKQQP
jgi:YbbR domain-containing protein